MGLGLALDITDATQVLTQVFPDPTGAVVKGSNDGDSLGGLKTATSPSRDDTTSKTDQSQRDATPKTDQSQDSSSSANINPDASGSALNNSDDPAQVPNAHSKQGSQDQTKDDGTSDNDRTLVKVTDCNCCNWGSVKRQHCCTNPGCA